MCGGARMNRIRNERIRGSLGITNIVGKIKGNGLR